jgi:hypothetical protein
MSPDPLAHPSPPWVHLLVTDDQEAVPPAPPGFAVRTLQGGRCRTKARLLDELARALAFPPHFGQSWDALEDCLTDLEWLPAAGYRLVVVAADRLLARDPAAYATFVALVRDVGAAWGTAATGHPGRGPVPFHTILVVPPRRRDARPDWGAAPLASTETATGTA